MMARVLLEWTCLDLLGAKFPCKYLANCGEVNRHLRGQRAAPYRWMVRGIELEPTKYYALRD